MAIYDPTSTGLYALPGNDVSHTLTVTNTGTGATDDNSIIIIDALPEKVTFYNGDYDGAGSQVHPIVFTDTNSNLEFVYTRDVAYSSALTKPTNFAACTYTPTAGYDANVRYICYNPKGIMANQTPHPSFALTYRARIQ